MSRPASFKPKVTYLLNFVSIQLTRPTTPTHLALDMKPSKTPPQLKSINKSFPLSFGVFPRFDNYTTESGLKIWA